MDLRGGWAVEISPLMSPDGGKREWRIKALIIGFGEQYREPLILVYLEGASKAMEDDTHNVIEAETLPVIPNENYPLSLQDRPKLPS